MCKIWILIMLIIGIFAQLRPINLNGPIVLNDLSYYIKGLEYIRYIYFFI